MTAVLAVTADHQRWYDMPDSRVAAVQVELRHVHRVEMHLDASERLAWAQHITVELDELSGLIMVTVMGLTVRLLKLPDNATNLLERCVTCDRPVMHRRGEPDDEYRHVVNGDGILPRKCYPDDPESTAVATPRKLAGMVLMDVPTEETSTVPLVETHAGQYVVMPTTIPNGV